MQHAPLRHTIPGIWGAREKAWGDTDPIALPVSVWGLLSHNGCSTCRPRIQGAAFESSPRLRIRAARLRLEPLEGRRLLAIFSATNVGALIADIGLANSNSDASNTINLAAGSYALSAGTGELLIQDTSATVHAKTLNIIGASANQTTIDGGGATRVFEIEKRSELDHDRGHEDARHQ